MAQFKMYEIDEMYLNLIDLVEGQEDEQSEAVKIALDNLTDEFNEKVINMAKLIQIKKGETETIKAEIARLQSLKKSKENAVLWLVTTIKDSMELRGQKKLETDLFKFTIRNNPPSVKYQDESIIPDKFTKITKTIDKVALKKALQDGLELDGVELVVSKSLAIK